MRILFKWLYPPRRSIQHRVARAMALLVTLLLCVFGLLAYIAFAHMEDDLVNAMLLSEAQMRLVDVDQLRQNYHYQAEQLGSELQVWWTPAGQSNVTPSFLQSLSPGLHEWHGDGITVHALIQDTPQGRLTLYYDASPHEQRVHQFARDMLLYGGGILLLVFVGAGLLARRAVQPLLVLTRHLEKWGPGKANLPIAQDDEAGRLVHAFNRMQDQVDGLLSHERAFAANLSHEIRTSLASLRSDAELLALNVHEESASRRLARMQGQVDAISQSLSAAEQVHSLRPSVQETIDLAEFLEQVWGSVALEAEQRGVRLCELPKQGISLTLDSQALFMIVRVLFRNICKHASGSEVRVSWQYGHVLAVQDTGPGIASEEQELIFTRGFSCGYQFSTEDTAAVVQHGLGLALARQVAVSQNWDLQVLSKHADMPVGTCFLLDVQP